MPAPQQTAVDKLTAARAAAQGQSVSVNVADLKAAVALTDSDTEAVKALRLGAAGSPPGFVTVPADALDELLEACGGKQPVKARRDDGGEQAEERRG